VTKVRQIQTNFTAGEADPQMLAREDINLYYNAVKTARNVLSDPRGGIRRRPGMQRLRKLGKTLSRVDISGATITAPHGGTVANIRDGDETTYLTTTDNLSTTNPFIIVKVDLGALTSIAAVDVVNYKLSSLALAGEIRVRTSPDDITYTDFGTPFDWDATNRSRREKNAAGAVNHRYIQVVRVGATDIAATCAIAEIRVWSETATLSPCRFFPFAFSTEEAYMMAGSDQNIDIFTGPDYQASAYIPHTAAKLPVMNFTQSLDTLLLFHPAQRPYKLFRQGGIDEFDWRDIKFDNTPQNDYGVPASVSAGVNEVQTITATFVSGDSFTLKLQGVTTYGISGNATQATVAANIQAALRALSNTSATGITVARVGSTYVVTFGGADGNRPWEQMICKTTGGSHTGTVARTTLGLYPGSSAGSEVQLINISAALAATSKFTLLLEGKRTAVINGNATPATVAANIQAALEALANVGAGNVTVASVTDGYSVTFTNAAANRPWLLMDIEMIAGTVVANVTRTSRGFFPGEDIMSDLRGWPRCGAFYQERLYMGGISSAPNAILASKLSDFFDFDDGEKLDTIDATIGLLARADADQVSAIYQIVAGRHLTFFTNDTEFYIPNEPIDKDMILKAATFLGSKEGLRVYPVDGALIFLQGVKDAASDLEVATSVREFLWDITQQSYEAGLLSKFSSHLVKNPVDVTLRRAVTTGEADILIMVNEDGTATNYSTLRTESVNAFTRTETRVYDKLLNVCCDKKRNVYWATERMINGGLQRFVEMWNDDLMFDCGTIIPITAEDYIATAGQTVFTWTFTNPADGAPAIGVRVNGGRLQPSDFTVNLGAKTITLHVAAALGDDVRIASMVKTVTGADDLNGEIVQTFVDGTAGASYTVSGGSFTLSGYADTEIQYGFGFEVYGELMPLRLPGQQTLAGLKVRCTLAILNLYQTGSLEVRANAGNWQELQLQKLSDVLLDTSVEENLFTGEHRLAGLKGYAVGAPFEFRQAIDAAAPLTILGITREVQL
jgi:hypothetical protein